MPAVRGYMGGLSIDRALTRIKLVGWRGQAGRYEPVVYLRVVLAARNTAASMSTRIGKELSGVRDAGVSVESSVMW
jgi:hypothetical protein